MFTTYDIINNPFGPVLFLYDVTCRCCSPAVANVLGLTLFLLSSICPVSSILFKDTLHAILRFAKFSASCCLGISLLGQKYSFCQSNCVMFSIFFIGSAKGNKLCALEQAVSNQLLKEEETKK